MLSKLKNLFQKDDENKIVGIDIGSSSIKVVQLSRKKGVAHLDTFGEISLSPYAGKEIGDPVVLDDEKNIEALRDLLRESQVDSLNCSLSIPLKSSLMFYLKLPKVETSKIDELISFESRKYIPVPISEVQLDWSILPKSSNSDSDKLDVLVVAIHKDTLRKYNNIAKGAGLKLKFMEIETFSTIRSITKHDKNSMAIIDIGSSVTKFYVVESGIVRKSNIINIGSHKMLKTFGSYGQEKPIANGDIGSTAGKLLREGTNNFSEVPVDLSRIINEVKKNILDYQKTYSKDIPLLVLTGGGSIFKGILPFMKKSISIPIETADPFSRVDNPAYLDDTLAEAGPDFSVAIGLALRGLKK